MEHLTWKPGNMLYPVPPVLVTCRSEGQDNIFTAAWTGTICSDPPMVYISVRPERYSHDMIARSGAFCINLPCRALQHAVDYCGVKSGRNEDKFAAEKLVKAEGTKLDLPMLADSPVCLECSVTQILPLGSHDMFLGRVEAVHVDPALLDDTGRLHLEKADLITYSHGTYYALGQALGTFGWTVRKKKRHPKRK